MLLGAYNGGIMFSGAAYTKAESDARYVGGSGVAYTKIESDSRFEVSGTVLSHEAASDPHPMYLTESEGNLFYEASGTSELLDATLAGRFAVSGYHYAAGSGLIEDNESYHVQIGSGLYLGDNEIGFDTNFGDTRYTLSGSIPSVTLPLAGSGLTGGIISYEVGIGSGLYETADLVGFDTVFGDARYATSGSSTPPVYNHSWIGNGPFQVGSGVDGAWISNTAFNITSVWLWRGTPGTAGSGIVDLNKNGITMYITQANRPMIGWDDSDNKVLATNPDVTSIAAGDIITIDIDQIETGLPKDIMLVIQGS